MLDALSRQRRAARNPHRALRVGGVEGEDGDGKRMPAHVVLIEDSGAGSAMLVYGGKHGLRLTSPDGAVTVAEPYLSLAAEALVDVNQASVRRPAR
jgi:hypothetical protein